MWLGQVLWDSPICQFSKNAFTKNINVNLIEQAGSDSFNGELSEGHKQVDLW